MKKDICERLKEFFCLLLAMFGVAMIGIGIEKIYEPLVYIYGGIILIYIANLGIRKNGSEE